MRLIIILLCLAFIGSACSSSGSKSGEREASDAAATTETGLSQENLKLVHLDVRGMTCEGCEKAIVSSIRKLDGIEEASASHTAEEAIVKFDSTKTSMEAISQAISDAGYSVEGEKATEIQH